MTLVEIADLRSGQEVEVTTVHRGKVAWVSDVMFAVATEARGVEHVYFSRTDPATVVRFVKPRQPTTPESRVRVGGLLYVHVEGEGKYHWLPVREAEPLSFDEMAARDYTVEYDAGKDETPPTPGSGHLKYVKGTPYDGVAIKGLKPNGGASIKDQAARVEGLKADESTPGKGVSLKEKLKRHLQEEGSADVNKMCDDLDLHPPTVYKALNQSRAFECTRSGLTFHTNIYQLSGEDS